MKKFLSVGLATIISVSSVCINAFAISNTSISDKDLLGVNEPQIVSFAENLAIDMHKEIYNISNITVSITDKTLNDGVARYDANILMDIEHKADSVEQMAYVQGMAEELISNDTARIANTFDAMRKNPTLSVSAVSSLESRFNELEEYINSAGTSDFDLVFFVNINDGVFDVDNATVYSKDIMNGSLYEIDDLYVTAEKAKANGKEYADELKRISRLRVDNWNTYNRIAARDYAKQYTENSSTDCGHNLSPRVYTTKSAWNNSQYPYFENSCHNDCADLVSQAICHGGVPRETGQWDRLNDGNGTYGWAWTYVPQLTNYMLNRGYWTKETYSITNAGNIMKWNTNSHIALVTYNDGSIIKYTAHTSDVEDKRVTSYSPYSWYVIKNDIN